MTTDVDSSKSKSLAVDSLLGGGAAAAPNLSDSGRLDRQRRRMAAVPGTRHRVTSERVISVAAI